MGDVGRGPIALRRPLAAAVIVAALASGCGGSASDAPARSGADDTGVPDLIVGATLVEAEYPSALAHETGRVLVVDVKGGESGPPAAVVAAEWRGTLMASAAQVRADRSGDPAVIGIGFSDGRRPVRGLGVALGVAADVPEQAGRGALRERIEDHLRGLRLTEVSTTFVRERPLGPAPLVVARIEGDTRAWLALHPRGSAVLELPGEGSYLLIRALNGKPVLALAAAARAEWGMTWLDPAFGRLAEGFQERRLVRGDAAEP